MGIKRGRVALAPEIPVIACSQPPRSITVLMKEKTLQTKEVNIRKLMDERYCAEEAGRMFDWFQQYLPYGIYQSLYRLMEDRQKFLEKNCNEHREM